MNQFISCSSPDVELKWANDDYIRFCDGKSVIIIGYRVSFTQSEYDILHLLYKEREGLFADQIIERCFKHKDITVGNVAVHVYNINKKVAHITDRKIVVGDRKTGYKIVDDI